jgi:LysM repeat protein
VLDREEDEREPRARTVAERRRERDVAPSWERPARLEAYPSLRSRRLAELRIPPLLIAAVAIALAAILLFQLPALFGIGSKPAGATPTPTVGASVAPTSAAPTSIPGAPTPQVYIVQAGDTMSKIAARFHVPLQALIDANKTSVPDPNQVKIGQVVTIPTTLPTTVPGASG